MNTHSSIEHRHQATARSNLSAQLAAMRHNLALGFPEEEDDAAWPEATIAPQATAVPRKQEGQPAPRTAEQTRPAGEAWAEKQEELRRLRASVRDALLAAGVQRVVVVHSDGGFTAAVCQDIDGATVEAPLALDSLFKVAREQLDANPGDWTADSGELEWLVAGDMTLSYRNLRPLDGSWRHRHQAHARDSRQEASDDGGDAEDRPSAPRG